MVRHLSPLKLGSSSLAILLVLAVLSSFVESAKASPASVVLDVNSVSQTDTTVQTSNSFTKTFRVGVILDLSTGETLEVYAWQFVIHYDRTNLTAVADPPTANDFFAAPGTSCWTDFSCSENAGTLVNFGRVPAADWGGRILAGQASTVIKVDDPAYGPGTVLVVITTLAPAAGFIINGVDTLLANVAFEIDRLPPGPVSFTLSDVKLVKLVGTQPEEIPNITTGGAVSATITNRPPTAAGTVSNLNPRVSDLVSFDAATSTDDASITNYIWDFGAGDVDGDGFTDSSCDTVAMTCTSPTASYAFQTAGNYTVTLRVRDNQLATGSARNQLGEAAVNDQSSHISFNIRVLVPGSPDLAPIPPKTVDEQTLLTFTAIADDPTMDPLTFSLGPGFPAGASIGSTSGVFTWTPAENQGPGIYQITFVVSDPTPLTDYEIVTVTVNETNQAPVLTVPPNQTADEESALTFAVTATDPDTPANTVTFSCSNCVSLGAAFNQTTGMFSWTPAEAQGVGDYTFTFTATDNSTTPLSDTETVGVHVNEVNAPPTASFTVSNPAPVRGEVVTFDASASSDPDPGGSVVSYMWDFGDTGTDTGQTVSHIYTSLGSYTVTLTITDNAATTGLTSKPVTVVNQAPTISATPDRTSVKPNDPITLTLTYSDADGDPLTVSVNWGDGTVDTDPGTSAAHSYQERGSFTIVVTVLDNIGDPVTTSVQVNVNRLPTVSFTPASSSVPVSVSLTLTITSNDPDGTILTTTIDWGDGAVEPLAGPRSSATHTYSTQGTYTITITVADGFAETGSSSSQITVTRQPPTLTIAPDRTAATTSDPVTVSVTRTDPDGSIVTTRIDWGDSTVDLLTQTQLNATHTYATPGSYTITVTTTDTSGLTTTQTSTVTISQAPSTFPLPGGPIPWAALAIAVAAGVLLYVLKIRKPAKVPSKIQTK